MKNTSSKTTAANAQAETIKYEDARDECKEMHERAERDHWRLGEIAHHVETKYGEQTLAKLSEDSGFADCTLERHRSVYRAWMGKPAPGPVSYSVLRALQDHPDRYDIVTETPNLTQGKAQEIMRQWRAENRSTATSIEADQTDDDDLLEDAEQQQPKEEPAEDTAPTPGSTSTPAPAKEVKAKGAKRTADAVQADNEWSGNSKRWQADVVVAANNAIELAEVRKRCTPEQRRDLLAVIEPVLIETLRKASEAFGELARWLHKLADEAADTKIQEGRVKTSPKRAQEPRAEA